MSANTESTERQRYSKYCWKYQWCAKIVIDVICLPCSTLKQKIQELSSRPEPRKKAPSPIVEAPKAKVIVEQVPSPEVATLQQAVATLRYCPELQPV